MAGRRVVLDSVDGFATEVIARIETERAEEVHRPLAAEARVIEEDKES